MFEKLFQKKKDPIVELHKTMEKIQMLEEKKTVRMFHMIPEFIDRIYDAVAKQFWNTPQYVYFTLLVRRIKTDSRGARFDENFYKEFETGLTYGYVIHSYVLWVNIIMTGLAKAYLSYLEQLYLEEFFSGLITSFFGSKEKAIRGLGITTVEPYLSKTYLEIILSSGQFQTKTVTEKR